MIAPTPVTKAARLPVVRLLSLATATRDYARRVAAGTFETARPGDLEPLAEAMGPEIWGYQYARRLTGQPPWRARPDADEARERMIASDLMLGDVSIWERAIAVHDRLVQSARRFGDPRPEPLAVPSQIRDLLAERERAALERAERRRRRGEAQGGGLPPVPEEAVRHVPLPSKLV